MFWTIILGFIIFIIFLGIIYFIISVGVNIFSMISNSLKGRNIEEQQKQKEIDVLREELIRIEESFGTQPTVSESAAAVRISKRLVELEDLPSYFSLAANTTTLSR